MKSLGRRENPLLMVERGDALKLSKKERWDGPRPISAYRSQILLGEFERDRQRFLGFIDDRVQMLENPCGIWTCTGICSLYSLPSSASTSISGGSAPRELQDEIRWTPVGKHNLAFPCKAQ